MASDQRFIRRRTTSNIEAIEINDENASNISSITTMQDEMEIELNTSNHSSQFLRPLSSTRTKTHPNEISGLQLGHEDDNSAPSRTTSYEMESCEIGNSNYDFSTPTRQKPRDEAAVFFPSLPHTPRHSLEDEFRQGKNNCNEHQTMTSTPSSPRRNDTLEERPNFFRSYQMKMIRPFTMEGLLKPQQILHRPGETAKKETSDPSMTVERRTHTRNSEQQQAIPNPITSLFTRHRRRTQKTNPLPKPPTSGYSNESQDGTEATEGTADTSTLILPSPRRVTFALPGNNADAGAEFGSDTLEDVFISAIDHLEDEIDEHAYDDLIPLNVRIALEENVFGWSHLLSDICGHVFFTLSAYFITYQIVTWTLLRPVSKLVVEDTSSSIDGDSGEEGCTGKIGCLLYHSMGWFHAHADHQTPHSSSETEYQVEYMPILGMSYDTFAFLRFVLSAMAALNAFRVVRRRRKVWLRTPYGTKEYMNDAQHRRADLEEADRTTVLGRIRSTLGQKRDAILANRVKKKIRKAAHRFERKRRHRATQLASGLTHLQAASHHHRVRVLSENGPAGKEPAGRKSRRRSSGKSSGRSGVIYHQINEPHYHHELKDNQIDSHTLPTFVMQSIAQDQIRFHSGYIDNVPYAHGGFFGAAPFLLANPYWIDILRHLMPDVYVEISRRVVYAPAPKLIHWAENNPVMAAYGTAHEMEYSGKVPTLEWDVFLDPNLVRRLEIVLTERDKFLRSRATAERQTRSDSEDGPPSPPPSPASPPTAADTTHSEFSVTTENERKVLRYYNNEIKRRTDILVDRMFIAHGNLTQLVLEQTGYLKNYNFSRVKRTRRTLGGGIYAGQWLGVYAEALKMGMGYREDKSDATDDEGLESDDDLFLPKLSKEGEREEELTSCTSTFPSSGNSSPRSLSSSSIEDYNLESIPLLTKDGDGITAPGIGSSSLNHTQSSGCDSTEQMDNRYSEGFEDGDSSSVNATAHVSSTRSHKPKRKKKKKKKGGCYKEGDYVYCDGSCMQNGGEQCRKCSHQDVGGNFSFEQQRTPLSAENRFKQRKASRETRRNQRRTDPTSLSSLSRATVQDTSISESIALLKNIMKCNAPLGLVLDIKSRHVPKRIWALVVDKLRDAGARVEGIGTFSIDDIRDISAYCSSPVKEITFFHSAGDLQLACNQGKVKRGDTVFFNAGSLLWDKPDWSDYDVAKSIVKKRCFSEFSAQATKREYKIMPYARVSYGPKSDSEDISAGESNSSFDDDSYTDDTSSVPSVLRTFIDVADSGRTSSTIQDYKDYFDLSIGLYCQEFAIDDAAIDLLVAHVNANPHVYDMGLSWGGINGVTVRGIQPGRFTNTDGLWNQRYAGEAWDTTKYPPVDEL